jgi:hypothetical protein
VVLYGWIDRDIVIYPDTPWIDTGMWRWGADGLPPGIIYRSYALSSAGLSPGWGSGVQQLLLVATVKGSSNPESCCSGRSGC